MMAGVSWDDCVGGSQIDDDRVDLPIALSVCHYCHGDHHCHGHHPHKKQHH